MFEGYTPSVPVGEKLDYGSQQFRSFEDAGALLLLLLPPLCAANGCQCWRLGDKSQAQYSCSVHSTMVLADAQHLPLTISAHAGVKAAAHAAFVLVAGGLGERLGYSGIKLALPADSARNACFLQVQPCKAK